MSNITKVLNTEREVLFFRRQFLISDKEFSPNSYWHTIKLHGNYYLSVHNDLPYHIETSGKRKILVLGSVFDPFNPQSNEREIIRRLLVESIDINSLLVTSKILLGRFICIFIYEDKMYMFTDPLGFRQLFYFFEGNRLHIGSQPEILKQQCNLSLSNDPELVDFFNSDDFIQSESMFVGNKTIYEKCFHLLPNHYLDIEAGTSIRFWPDKTIQHKSKEESAALAAKLLKGSLAAITNREKTKIALTAGWDSRLLLAATYPRHGSLKFYLDKKNILSDDHKDIIVSRQIAEKFSLKFKVENSKEYPPDWFMKIIKKNITGARGNDKTKMIWSHFINNNDCVIVKGSGNEIARNFYDKKFKIRTRKIDIDMMARLIGYCNKPPFLIKELKEWVNSLPVNIIDEHCEYFNILDLLYWEHRMGNWGAMFPAEQDISAEEIELFNCRLYIETVLSCKRKLRGAPHYSIFREIIKNLWPELLNIPINPQKDIVITLKKKVKFYFPAAYKKISSYKKKIRKG